MVIWLILAFIFAALEVLALSKNWIQLEYLVKPAVMVGLFIWLYLNTGLQGLTFWFGLGVLFSLLGDVLLMFPSDRFFVLGLGSFLLAHCFYIVGFQNQLSTMGAGSLLVVVVLGASAIRILRRILSAIRAKGQDKLVIPIILYSTVISIMLFAAMTTIFDPEWATSASFFVSVGAFLFYMSDIILAWNKFVSPVKNGNILNIVLYHLGQISLIAGIVSHFA